MEEIQRWQTFTFGAWNVRGLSQKKADVVTEVERENEDVVVLTETKLRGTGQEDLDSYHHLFSGVSYKGGMPCAGVSILIRKKHCQDLIWGAVNERIIWAELCMCDAKVVVIGAYMVDECRSDDKREAFLEKLREVILDIAGSHEVIILGDFNAHIGRGTVNNPVIGKHGVEQNINKNGSRLIELCSKLGLRIQNTFFRHRDIHKYTWYGNGTKKSLVDYCITRQNSALKVLDVVACRWLDCGTDHVFLEATIAFPCSEIQSNGFNENVGSSQRYKSFLLFSKAIQAKFKQRLDADLDINATKTKSIDEVYEYLRGTVHAAAKHVLGDVEEDLFGQFLWDREIRELRWLRENQDNDNLTDPSALDENIDPKLKKEVWVGICGEINRKEKSKQYKIIKGIVEELVNVTHHENAFCDINLLLNTFKKRYTEIQDCFTPLFDDNSCQLDDYHLPTVSITDIEISFDDLEYSAYSAPGGFNVNLLKFSSLKTKTVLRDLIQSILDGGKIPRELKDIYVYPQSNMSNESGVSEDVILHPILNLICSLLKKELEKQQSFKNSCIQCKSPSDSAFVLRLLLQKSAAKQKPLVEFAIINMEKCFSSVPLEILLEKMQRQNVSVPIVHLIRSLIIGNSIRIIKEGGLVEEIEHNKGLMPSCTLAPLLFRFYIKAALMAWEDQVGPKGLKIGTRNLSYIYSCNKLVVFSNTKSGLEIMLEKLNEHLADISLIISPEMVSYLGDSALNLGQDSITARSTIQFQGCILERDGRNKNEVSNRMKEARNIIGLLHPCGRDEMLPDTIKRRIFNTIIKGIMTLGCETWTLTEPLKRSIDAVELRYWKWCCERLPGGTGSDAPQLMGVTWKVSQLVMLKKAAWYTRLQEMDGEEWVKWILEWEPEGKRMSGGQRKKWTDGLEEFIRSVGKQVLGNAIDQKKMVDASVDCQIH